MDSVRPLYLELLKKTLTDLHRADITEYKPATGRKLSLFINPWLRLFGRMEKRKLAVCEVTDFTIQDRMNGKDWPSHAETMIGYKRLSNVQDCVTDVINNNIEGDLVETGVWRGGTVIFMKAILRSFNITDRVVWVADSFEGLPKPNSEKYEADKDDEFYKADRLRISLEKVKQNFEKYGLLDENVKFLKGWFKDTLPVAPIHKLAILRLDGDMYESTMDGLVNLYPKLSKGGYIIIDDWGSVEGCRLAVQDYRKKSGITEKIIPIDEDGVFWKKDRD
ncbi:MAG: TylF/MycF/NovP-related O-methyltransferase [Chitinophagaceae bacterium]